MTYCVVTFYGARGVEGAAPYRHASSEGVGATLAVALNLSFTGFASSCGIFSILQPNFKF